MSDNVYFWRVDEPPYGCLSQWYFSDFEYCGQKYISCEQWMMANKAILFRDSETLKKILDCDDNRKIKNLGREIKNFNESVWTYYRMPIVIHGNMLKFSQNAEIKNILMKTGKASLIEASPYDKIWGIGITAKDAEHRLSIGKGIPGLNLLGKCLEEVRTLLKLEDRESFCEKV